MPGARVRVNMFAERGWPNTPLADYLDVDFATDSISIKLMPA